MAVSQQESTSVIWGPVKGQTSQKSQELFGIILDIGCWHRNEPCSVSSPAFSALHGWGFQSQLLHWEPTLSAESGLRLCYLSGRISAGLVGEGSVWITEATGALRREEKESKGSCRSDFEK